MKDVTALVKAFLRDDYLFDCVRSLRETYPEIHIIVADDGNSSDEKEEQLRQLGVSKYIRLPFNSGLSVGRNAMVDACDTPYLLLCDDDLLFTSETRIENLRRLMDISDIASGAFLNYGTEVFNYEMNLNQGEGRFWLSNVTWPPFSDYEGVRYGKCDLTHNIFVADTEVIRRIRWEPNIKVRYEHEDFFMSAKLQGASVVYCPDVLVLHKKQGYPASSEYASHRWDDAPSREAFIAKWGFIW
jgi:GT2 family glycosyltransferase